MTDQLPLPGPEKGYCECTMLEGGCGKFGLLGKPDHWGHRHVRGCPCRRCLGRRNKRSGARKQRAARNALGIAGPSLGADHEENWRGAVRHEVKSGAQVRPPWTAYLRMEAQSDGSHAIGDNRPFAGIAMPPGTSDGLVLVRLSKVVDFAYAVVEQIEHESSKH